MSAQMKGFNPKEVKQIASDIIKAGAALYDALGMEPELREHRARAIAGHVDTDFVERSVMEAVSQVCNSSIIIICQMVVMVGTVQGWHHLVGGIRLLPIWEYWGYP